MKIEEIDENVRMGSNPGENLTRYFQVMLPIQGLIDNIDFPLLF
jgi:hypothetical protein